MNKESLIFEVSQESFAKSVLFNSNKVPVVVEFMGIWSKPCVIMADLFSQLAEEFAGEFIFAKVDIDENPELRKEYQIENVPTLLVFKDEKVVRKEVGQIQEVEARGLLKDFNIFHQSDLIREQAREKHLSGDTPSAILMLTDAIKNDPSNTRIALEMVQIFIDIGEIAQAQGLFSKLPEQDQSSEMGKALNGQLTFAELAGKTKGLNQLEKEILEQPDNSNCRFDLAICLVATYQYEAAVDHLFIILEKEPDFKEGAVKEMLITISNMISPVNHDLASQFRRRLANLSL